MGICLATSSASSILRSIEYRSAARNNRVVRSMSLSVFTPSFTFGISPPPLPLVYLASFPVPVVKCGRRKGVNLLNVLLSFLKSTLPTVSDWINAISLIISICTLVSMLRLRRRIRIELDKRDLGSKKHRLVKELLGFEISLRDDGLYTKDFLQKIDLHLSSILVNYSCLSWSLNLYIRYTIYFLNHYCLRDTLHEKQSHMHKLCKMLQKISILIGKEP